MRESSHLARIEDYVSPTYGHGHMGGFYSSLLGFTGFPHTLGMTMESITFFELRNSLSCHTSESWYPGFLQETMGLDSSFRWNDRTDGCFVIQGYFLSNSPSCLSSSLTILSHNAESPMINAACLAL